MNILYLHHSTGGCIWRGGVPAALAAYNGEHRTAHTIVEQAFPQKEPYGWANYPYDYWNIWVQHAGPEPYQNEPTLEILTRDYQVIVFKHCFPVSQILPDTGSPDLASKEKRLENYKLQYAALKIKLAQFPRTQFLIWTGAALTRANTTPENAARARQFAHWVKTEWDRPDDNIHLWDFFELETDGGLYLKDEYAVSPTDSHPNDTFSRRVAPLFCQTLFRLLH